MSKSPSTKKQNSDKRKSQRTQSNSPRHRSAEQKKRKRSGSPFQKRSNKDDKKDDRRKKDQRHKGNNDARDDRPKRENNNRDDRPKKREDNKNRRNGDRNREDRRVKREDSGNRTRREGEGDGPYEGRGKRRGDWGLEEKDDGKRPKSEKWGKKESSSKDTKSPTDKPNYEPSGALQEDDGTLARKYAEPPDARIPDKHWRIYVFKEKQQVDVLRIHRNSAYLIGRDRKVCDIPMHHPSLSKQHAVLQFRQKSTLKPDGSYKTEIKPYIIDLESTNGTFINAKKCDVTRYYELLEGDVLRFAHSSRDYVILHSETKDVEEN